MNDTEIMEKLLTHLAQRVGEVNSEIEEQRYIFDFNEWEMGNLSGKRDMIKEIQDFIDNIR
jgi:hypothetical protein